METDQNKFLSRLDIINTLNSRHLHIPDIENLTYEELLRIFKTFAVPLEKRHVRQRSNPFHYCNYRVQTYDFRSESDTFGGCVLSEVQIRAEAQRMLAGTQIIQQQSPHILQQAKYLKLSFNTISNQAPKRYSMHGEEMPGGPTPPKKLMISP